MSAGRVRRALVFSGAAVLFAVLVGATYQGITTSVERRRFPFPGRLVDAGGHQLHLHCTGAGAPTVVLEAPASGMSAAWGWVQLAVSDETRVCSYDRAGLGWSEAGGTTFSPGDVPVELHAALEESGEPGPYVMAGHGLGALFARMYAARHPAEVASLVLVDAPGGPGLSSARPDALGMLEASPWLARTGILRLANTLADQASGLPGTSAGALAAFLNRPDHLTRAAREVGAWQEILDLAARAALASDLPVTQVASPGPPPVFLASQRDADRVTAALLERVRAYRKTDGSTHP